MGRFWNVLLEHESYEGAGRQGQTQSNSGWWQGPTEILSSDIGFEIASFPRFRIARQRKGGNPSPKKPQNSTKNSFSHRNSKLHVSFQKSALRQYLLLPLNRNRAKKHESNRNSMFCIGGGNVKLHIFHRTQRISFLYSEHSNSGLIDYKGWYSILFCCAFFSSSTVFSGSWFVNTYCVGKICLIGFLPIALTS